MPSIRFFAGLAVPGLLAALSSAAAQQTKPPVPVSPLASADSRVSADPVVYHARHGMTEVGLEARTADALEAEVKIDGIMDEAVWATAPVLTGFSQYSPTDGRPAPDSTEVRVWYSAHAIYFGIRAFEPHGSVRATLAERDHIQSDDYVEIHLDTFREQRRAFVFIVNPLGIQADGTKNEGGGWIPGSNIMPGMNDLSADFHWQSHGRVTDNGYEVEVRIPYTSLRFPSSSQQTWGIQFNRRVQHSGYETTWTPVARGNASFTAQQGYLSGMTGLVRGVDVELNPELTNTSTGLPGMANGLSASGWRYENSPGIGGNIRAGLGSNFVLNGAVKPDFSQVEADATQVAADQRFALFYPERRPFFVEGADAFNVPNTLIYTRTIVQPAVAAKLTGRVGRSNVALLSAYDAPSGLSADLKSLVNVVRVTRDFSEQSRSGLLYSGRSSDRHDNQLLGADLTHVFGGMYYASAQYANSSTNDHASGSKSSGSLWELAVDRTGRRTGFHYNLTGVQPGFESANGFVARTGYVKPNASNRLTFFGSPGAAFEQYQVFFSYNGVWQYDDFFKGKSLLESSLSMRNGLTFRGGWTVSYTPELATFAFDAASHSGVFLATGSGPVAFTPSPRITRATHEFSVGTPQFQRFSASAGITHGNDVDFFETARVRRTALNGSLDWRPDSRLRVNATYASNEFTRRIDGSTSFSTQIPRLKLEYQMTRSVFVRLVTQYEATRREALRDWRTGELLLVRAANGAYVPSVAEISNLLRADWLFAYRPSPGTVFFAGYGSSLREPEALAFDRLRRVEDGIFVKASWVMRFGAR